MRRLMLATFAGAALLAGAGAASAQTFYDDGYASYYGTPSAGYYGYAPGSGSHYATPWNSAAPRGGTYKSEAFKSQEVLPQSPPGGGP